RPAWPIAFVGLDPALVELLERGLGPTRTAAGPRCRRRCARDTRYSLRHETVRREWLSRFSASTAGKERHRPEVRSPVLWSRAEQSVRRREEYVGRLGAELHEY